MNLDTSPSVLLLFQNCKQKQKTKSELKPKTKQKKHNNNNKNKQAICLDALLKT